MAENKRRLEMQRAECIRMGAIATILLILPAGRSQAQFGYGGFGFGIQQPLQLEANALNSWALNNGSAAAANRPQPLIAPRFQGRDDGFFERYDLATHEVMVNRIARNPGREMSLIRSTGVRQDAPITPTPRPVAAERARPIAAEEPTPVVLLVNFFDRNLSLAWPIEAPITDGMGKKRDVADHAILTVLREYESRGIANPSSVTEARQRLLDYGRPALDFIRKQATPAIADSFHSFLLGLYSQVGLAGTIPRAT